ncbi:hypothetical protein BSKO_00283 [Bryopsis sp. KO-2023]|nr:hypothetical protein BSKO_00283 [Bryopsis sp. KO-2023]
MRRVQFALGPWEHFPDGHPPEKSCEEERRAYRHGLTLQSSKELSFLEQGILWFESSFQSSASGSDGGACDDSTHLLGTSVEPDWPGANMEEYNASLLGQNRVNLRHDSVTSLEEYLPGTDKKSLEREMDEWDSGTQLKTTDNKLLRKGCEDVFITIPPGGLANCGVESAAFEMEDTFYNGYVANSYPCGSVKRMLGGVLLVMAVVVAMAFFQV